MLDSVGITANKNTIPYDTQKPFITSGLRLGTPALTTRGMKEGEMREVGVMIAKVLGNRGDSEVLEKVRGEVKALCERFPLYKSMGV